MPRLSLESFQKDVALSRMSLAGRPAGVVMPSAREVMTTKEP